MTTKHTPGPWRTGDAGMTIFGPPSGPSPKTIARLPKISAPCKVSDIDENIANSRLISAAPDLLAALNAVLELEGEAAESNLYGMGEVERNVFGAARAAIAKATGGAK